MATVVLGGGIAGLAAAIKLRLKGEEVLLVDKLSKTANTFMAGMRFRLHKPGVYNSVPSRSQMKKDLAELLSFCDFKDRVERFSELIISQVFFWEKEVSEKAGVRFSLRVDYKPQWFGPQWEEGRGERVLRFLGKIAEKIGVIFFQGKLVDLLISNGWVEEAVVKSYNRTFSIEANRFVIATGSATGFLAASTNLKTNGSQILLYFEKSLPLTGATSCMIHPFGRSLKEGVALPGCWATDEIKNAKVVLKDGSRGFYIERLLSKHRAHDKFKEIIKYFSQRESLVNELILSSNKKAYSRVSVHYWQLGLKTDDGIIVSGFKNLFAIGDSEAWWFTGFKPRIPGLALAKALVDAEILSLKLGRKNGRVNIKEKQLLPRLDFIEKEIDSAKLEEARKITSYYLIKFYLAEGDFKNLIEAWKERIRALNLSKKIERLYFSIIKAYERRYIQGEKEPVVLENFV